MTQNATGAAPPGSARRRRALAMAVLAALAGSLSAMPGLARGGRGSRRATDNSPANANAAMCRTRARDYAYEKHADAGQERMAFDRCMGK